MRPSFLRVVGLRPAFALVTALSFACYSPAPRPAPRDRFHFPSGLAADVPFGADAGLAHFLYVGGFGNFDLAYDNGLFYAVNLDQLGPPATGLLPPALLDGGWDGTPVQFPDLDGGNYVDPNSGVLITDSMPGQLRLTTTSAGTQRLFLATRFSNEVTVIEAAGGEVSCYGGGSDCSQPPAATPLVIEQAPGANQVLDVFGVSDEVITASGERDIFITHLRNQGYGSGGVYSSGSYGNNFSTVGTDYLIQENVDQPGCFFAEPVGSVGVSTSLAYADGDELYAFFTGRYGGITNAIRQVAFPAGSCTGLDGGNITVDPNPPGVFTLDLSTVTKGNDGRGTAFSSRMDRAYALLRNPDALLVLNNDGIIAGTLGMRPVTAVPLPAGPSEILTLGRTSASGASIGDLVVISCPDSNQVAFYDDELGQVTNVMAGVGNQPFSLAATVRSLGTGSSAQVLPGARIFSLAFGSGQLAVIDVPDLLDASSAQVVALIGTFEDTSATPINPNSNILSVVGVGGGQTGIP